MDAKHRQEETLIDAYTGLVAARGRSFSLAGQSWTHETVVVSGMFVDQKLGTLSESKNEQSHRTG